MNDDSKKQAKDYYLSDLGTLLRERALQAKEDCQKEKHEFNHGRLMGYYEVISLMIHQAEAFGIELSELNLGLDPDDLLQ